MKLLGLLCVTLSAFSYSNLAVASLGISGEKYTLLVWGQEGCKNSKSTHFGIPRLNHLLDANPEVANRVKAVMYVPRPEGEPPVGPQPTVEEANAYKNSLGATHFEARPDLDANGRPCGKYQEYFKSNQCRVPAAVLIRDSDKKVILVPAEEFKAQTVFEMLK